MRLKRYIRTLSLLIGLSAVISAAEAANFTTTVVQGSGAAWTGTIWNPGGVAPTAGNTYEMLDNGTRFGNNLANTRVRNPAVAGVQTFPGDQLIMNTNTEIRWKQAGAILNFPGVGGNPGLVLRGGVLGVGDDGISVITGKVQVAATSFIVPGDNGGGAVKTLRGVNITGQLSGSGGITIYQAGTNTPQEISGNLNTYSGNWLVQAGWLKGSGTNSLGTGNITIDPAALLDVDASVTLLPGPALLEVSYDIRSPGKLTLRNGGLMNLHQNCTFTGVTIEGASLAIGTHSYAELSANYPFTFLPGGSGSITVQAATAPPAPANPTLVNGDGQVIISWLPSALASGYVVSRSSTSGGPYTTATSTGSLSATDTGLANGATYYYVVTATNTFGTSVNSAQVIGHPNVSVTGLTAVGAAGKVTVNWTAVAGSLSYSVNRSLASGGPYTNIASGLTVTSFVDTAVQNGTVYYYMVTAALNSGFDSGLSAEVSGITAPSTPTITASLFAGTVITVQASTTDGAIPQYVVEQSKDLLAFTPLATLSNSITGYTNTGLTLGTTYYYRVKAQNAAGVSAYSNIATNTTPTFALNVNFGTAANGTPANNPSPTPPGYVEDVGLPFAAQTNGLSYGWDRDVSVDGRWRQSALSPDLRYDTFVHLQKASPPAVWEIQIPNGFYSVHIVAGDATATDSTFQHSVEGVITPTVIPVTGAFFADYTVTTVVSDGRLTITTGPAAANAKINFVDIYSAIPVNPSFATQPQSISTEEFHSVSLSAGLAAGSTPLVYQWYFNNSPLSSGTNATLTFATPHIADSGSYYLVVKNFGGSVTSSVATVAIRADTTAPTVVSTATLDGNVVGLEFSEPIDPSTFPFFDPTAYTINGSSATINVAVLRPDASGIALYLNTPVTGTYTLGVKPVFKDLAGNLISSTGLTVTGTVANDIVTDIGSPGVAGSYFTADGNTIELVGGGADIWGTNDQFYFVGKNMTNDFDARVHVASLIGTNAIAKAVIMARESTDQGSRTFHISVNPPPPGRNEYEVGIRTNIADVSTSLATFIPASIPNDWLRITRVGNLFSGYRSSNGVDWILMSTNTQAFSTKLLVGIGVTAHDNTTAAVGTFDHLTINSGVAVVATPPNLVRPAFVSGKFSASLQTQVGAIYQIQYTDSLKPAFWGALTNIAGTGASVTFTDSGAIPATKTRFYRVFVP